MKEASVIVFAKDGDKFQLTIAVEGGAVETFTMTRRAFYSAISRATLVAADHMRSQSRQTKENEHAI